MFKLFDYDNPVMQFLNKVFDLMLLGILWLVCSLPVITLGAATTAMYTVLFKLVNNDGYTVIRLFFKAFRENFKQATLIWLILAAAFLLLGMDLFLVWLFSSNWVWAFVLAMLVLVAVLAVFVFLYVFPLQAYFDNAVRNTLKNALLISVAHLAKTLFMLALDVGILLLVMFYAQPLLLFVGVLPAAVNAWFLNKILAKYAGISNKEADQENT